MIKIICVGKIKEKFYTEAVNEYMKRLSKYSKINIIEVIDDNSDNINKALNNEKEQINKHIKSTEYIIVLDIDGVMLDSIEFANKINNLFIDSNSDITFIIGGSQGIHNDIKEKANLRLSFSKMTFPHQLFRVVLLEQIYRTFKIINNETYHK